MGLSLVARALLRLRLCDSLQTHSHPHYGSEKPHSRHRATWRQLRSAWDSNQQAVLVHAQVFPADAPLSKTALGVSQKDLIVLCWTTVSVSVYFRTRVSCFSRNSWYLFLKPKIRRFPYSKTFYFT